MMEVLHALQKGLYLYALAHFWTCLGGDSIHDFLVHLVMHVFFDCIHQIDCDMPHLKFSNGVQSYTNLHAHEMTGVLLLLAIALHCHFSWDTYNIDQSTKNSFAHSSHCNTHKVKEYHDLFELLLCFEQGLKLPSI